MSQAIQVIPTISQLATTSGSASVDTESPESGQSFESALAGQLAGGEAAVGEAGTTETAATDATPDAGASMAAVLAASGNTLPPPLPPVPVDLAALVAAGTEVVSESLAGTSAAPLAAVADALKTNESAAPVAQADGLIAAAPLPSVPVSMPPPVGLPAREGQSASASVESALNRPAVSNIAARTAAVDAQTLGALSAEDTAGVAAAKTADVPPSLEVFRSVLKEISPTAADVRPPLTSLLAASGPLTANSFANPMASSPTPGAPVASAAITVPFGQAGWGQAFGNQVVWAVNQGMPAAELHLSPPDLGPMSVRISMDQDQANIAFSSPHAMVREAVEAALPRLRDMLGSQGITLVDVNVSQHGSSEPQREPGEWRNGPASGEAGAGTHSARSTGPMRAATGMLDVYV